MTEHSTIDSKLIGHMYDQQAEAYAEFADDRFAWQYLERPAFDRYIFDLYTPQTRVLDIGCGTGVVARHLISRGVLPEHIIGIDPSARQLEQARAQTPGVTFAQGAANEIDLPSESIDLAITNTVLHHLDNETLEQMLDRVYDALTPGGSYFFVDVDPDHNAEGRDPANTNQWTTVRTPWGTEVPFFNRHPTDLVDILDRHGFDKVDGWVLDVDPAGMTDPENYARYVNRPSRMAARYRKVPEMVKALRVHDVRIPDLIENETQKAQRQILERYFHAWQTQSVEEIGELFADDAIYDEKPGKELPLQGIEAIQDYWRLNPVSQENIQIESHVIGFSGADSIWAEFKGGFDVRGRHIDIHGVIQFAIDLETGKITRLTEYFETEKKLLEE